MQELPAPHADLLINASFVSFLLFSVSIPRSLCWNHFFNKVLVSARILVSGGTLLGRAMEESCW